MIRQTQCCLLALLVLAAGGLTHAAAPPPGPEEVLKRLDKGWTLGVRYQTIGLRKEVVALDLSGLRVIDGEMLGWLRVFPHLESLCLARLTLTQEQVNQVARLTSLRALDLERTKITKDRIRLLSGLTKLELLDLSLYFP